IHGALAPAATPLVLNGEGLRGGHHVHRREKCGSNDERAGLCSEFHCDLAGKLLPPESEQHNMAAWRRHPILPHAEISSCALAGKLLPPESEQHNMAAWRRHAILPSAEIYLQPVVGYFSIPTRPSILIFSPAHPISFRRPRYLRHRPAGSLAKLRRPRCRGGSSHPRWPAR